MSGFLVGLFAVFLAGWVVGWAYHLIRDLEIGG